MELEKLVKDTVDATIKELTERNMTKTPNEAYYKTINLLLSYKDLKKSVELNGVGSKTLELIDKALESLSDDPYCNILKYYYMEDYVMEDVAEMVNLHVTQVYKHRKRLVKRLSVILFGDDGVM